MFSERLLPCQGFVNLLFGRIRAVLHAMQGWKTDWKGGKENRAWTRVALTFSPVTCFCLLSFIKAVIYSPLTSWQRVLMRTPLDTTEPANRPFVIANSLLIKTCLSCGLLMLVLKVLCFHANHNLKRFKAGIRAPLIYIHRPILTYHRYIRIGVFVARRAPMWNLQIFNSIYFTSRYLCQQRPEKIRHQLGSSFFCTVKAIKFIKTVLIYMPVITWKTIQRQRSGLSGRCPLAWIYLDYFLEPNGYRQQWSRSDDPVS